MQENIIQKIFWMALVRVYQSGQLVLWRVVVPVLQHLSTVHIIFFPAASSFSSWLLQVIDTKNELETYGHTQIEEI